MCAFKQLYYDAYTSCRDTLYYAKRRGGYYNVMCICTHGWQVSQGFHFVFLLIYSGDLYTNKERKQFMAAGPFNTVLSIYPIR